MGCELMSKHAYLIMAHNNFDFLKKELELLDDERNDIFIHIDKKAGKIDEDYIRDSVKKSKIKFIARKSIQWAAYSGIQCEVNLLKEAVNNDRYDYYHLLSGADLPLKNQDEIHAFFEKENGKEFLNFDSPVPRESDMKRIRKYYIFQHLYGRNRKNPILVFLFVLDKILGKIQDMLHVNRYKKEPDFLPQKGANWFSITHELALEVINREKWIRKHFIFSRSGDEVFLQTIVNSTDFKHNLYRNGRQGCLRKIDWGRGKPYTWRIGDYDELMYSGFLFARKFDPVVDEEIIEKVYDTLKN